MRRDHTRKLVDADVATRRALAALPPDTPVGRIQEPVLERLRQQAELQVRSEGVDPPFFELLEPEAPDPVAVANGGGWRHRGFAALPEPSPGDVFFDMEGDRFALEGGLEYLFGVVYLDDAGEAQYRDFWAHDREDEGRAFEQFVDWLSERRRVFPELHVYHYAPYEPVALKRLMGMHGTREAEVDELLRGEAFVDLYAVFRQGVRYGSESYSLKQVERLYTARPEGEVMDAGASVVAYEHYLADHDPQRLEAIRAYNEDDCRSAYLLRDWLEVQREVLVARLGPMARPAPGDGAPSEQVQERDERAAELTDQLLDGLPAEADDRTADDQARWLLAHLLQFHRREEKPDWWAYFQQRDYLGDDDFLEDRECIGGLELDGLVGTERKSTVVRYRFPPQDHKFGIGSEPFDPFGLRPAGRVARVDDIAGTIDLVRGPSLNDVPHPRALMPRAPVSQNAQADAIVRVAEAVLTDGLDTPGYQAACDLLRRRPPRLVGTLPVGPIARLGEHGGDAARRVVGSLDHTSLAVQGPPGSGKTYTGARMIVDLVRSGKRVGITAHSHAAIGNLLDAMCEHAAEAGVKVRALQKAEDHQRCTSAEVECVGGNDEVVTAIGDDRVDVVAGTSWLWACADMAGSVDVLFVDEAGQKSLADVVAMSGAAESVVLLGDPQQLAQPSKGVHPKGAEASALAHLLGDAATLPEDLGLFLGTTYRMHPAVCAFVSEVAYDERLHSEPGLEGQAIAGEAGLRLELVEHRGNRSSSLEEAEAVDALVHAQMGRPWTDADVRTRPLMLDDVLVIAPYNAQVAMLRQHLPAGARVGTVDKFQGREAPLTIYSMATSTPDDIPRGMDFLYDLHRLNVAVSRARAMCVLVCSPALFDALCRTPEQVRLANALCRYRELAAPPS